MSENFNVGDHVVATVDLGHGVKKGTHGHVTHVSTFHGLLSVTFSNSARIESVKLHQVARA
jgi:hypothetical protein